MIKEFCKKTKGKKNEKICHEEKLKILIEREEAEIE